MSIQDPSDYKTGDAVPSNKAMDLNDNAKVFDVFQNANIPFVTSRLGKSIKTIYGNQQDIDSKIAGWEASINSQFIYKNAGLWADAPSQITDADKLNYWIFTDGAGYAVKGSVTLPITKPASPVNDDNWFVATSVNKQQLRSDSASQLGYVYINDWFSGIVIPSNAMSEKKVVWHSGNFYSIGTDAGFTSTNFSNDELSGKFVKVETATKTYVNSRTKDKLVSDFIGQNNPIQKAIEAARLTGGSTILDIDNVEYDYIILKEGDTLKSDGWRKCLHNGGKPSSSDYPPTKCNERPDSVTDNWEVSAKFIVHHDDKSIASRVTVKNVEFGSSPGVVSDVGIYSPRMAFSSVNNILVQECNIPWVARDIYGNNLKRIHILNSTLSDHGLEWFEETGSGDYYAAGTSNTCENIQLYNYARPFRIYRMSYSSMTCCGGELVGSNNYDFANKGIPTVFDIIDSDITLTSPYFEGLYGAFIKASTVTDAVGCQVKVNTPKIGVGNYGTPTEMGVDFISSHGNAQLDITGGKYIIDGGYQRMINAYNNSSIIWSSPDLSLATDKLAAVFGTGKISINSPSLPIYASVGGLNGSISVAGSDIVFPTKFKDAFNIYDTSSGLFHLKCVGRWRIAATIPTNVANALVIQLKTSTGTVLRQWSKTSPGIDSLSIDAEIDVNSDIKVKFLLENLTSGEVVGFGGLDSYVTATLL